MRIGCRHRQPHSAPGGGCRSACNVQFLMCQFQCKCMGRRSQPPPLALTPIDVSSRPLTERLSIQPLHKVANSGQVGVKNSVPNAVIMQQKGPTPRAEGVRLKKWTFAVTFPFLTFKHGQSVQHLSSEKTWALLLHYNCVRDRVFYPNSTPVCNFV